MKLSSRPPLSAPGGGRYREGRQLRVLLIYPPVLYERIRAEDVAVPPIGLYYVGAVLREKGRDVDILNWHHMAGRQEEAEDVLRRLAPDVIGFSVLHANRWGALDTARLAGRVLPGVRIVFGGIGATFLWDRLLEQSEDVDYVVLGEGERTFEALMEHLDSGSGWQPDHIPGIAFRRDGRPFRTPDAPLIEDLDSLPNPAGYFNFQHVAATRGCAGNCAFCGSPRFWGRRVRAHSPSWFVEGLELLHKRGVNFFFFSDDTFTADRERVMEICRMILKRGLAVNWFAIARVEHVDMDMLLLMRRAGCIQISYGVESGSEAVRRALNKPLSREKIRRAFSLTTRAGILARAYFIYGCPGESDETVEETLDLIREIRPLGAVFYMLEVFPGTSLYERLQKEGRITGEAWLERIEGIPYFELDGSQRAEDVLRWGKTLRDGYHRLLGGFARDVELMDGEGFSPLNADFCSRLAMTFSHGDYSRIEAVPDPDGAAEALYRRALECFPDHRAFLGLAVLYQKRGSHQEAILLAQEGLKHHGESEALNLCLGVSFMSIGRLDEALELFARFPGSREAGLYAEKCRGLKAMAGTDP
jgi:anaerobic magnesium-protoporphyrin IX monomethyl ester cyclase